MVTLTKFREKPFVAGSNDDPVYLFLDPRTGNILFPGPASIHAPSKRFALRQEDAYSEVVLEVQIDGGRVVLDLAYVADMAAAEEWVESANELLALFAQ